MLDSINMSYFHLSKSILVGRILSVILFLSMERLTKFQHRASLRYGLTLHVQIRTISGLGYS